MLKKRLKMTITNGRRVKTGVREKSRYSKQIRASGHDFKVKIGRNIYKISHIVRDGSKVRSITVSEPTVIKSLKYSLTIAQNSTIYFDNGKISMIESKDIIFIITKKKSTIEVDKDFICANF